MRYCLGLCLLLFTVGALAGNTTVNHVAARANSIQAFAAVADDPSAVYYNPAGITQLEGTQIDNGALIIFPYQKFTNSTNGFASRTDVIIPAPNLFVSSDYFGKVHVGMGIYASFARRTSFDINPAVLNRAHSSTFTRLEFTPTAAIKLNENVAIGGGLVITHLLVKPNIAGLDERARGWGVTGQGGLLVKATDAIKLAVVVHGPVTINVDGRGTLGGVLTDNYDADIPFPTILTLGGAWQVNGQWLLSLAYDREFWSTLKTVVKTYDNPAFSPVSRVVLNGRDSSNFRAGVRYTPNKQTEISAGYTYSEAAIPAMNILPAIPDFDSHYMSIGFSRYWEALRFDLGYEFGLGEKRTSTNMLFPGNHTAHLHTLLLGLGINLG